MKQLAPLLLLSFFLACAGRTSPETKFDRRGVSFTCPKGWKITEEDSLDSESYYLSCEKDGFVSSGLVTMSWLNDSIDLDGMIEIYQEELKNQKIFKNTNIKFDEIIDGSYNGIEARTSNYDLTLLGDRTEGTIYCFYGDTKTIAIIKQQSTEDNAKNKPGFEVIESTFTIK